MSSLLTVVPRVNADPRTSNSKAVPAINRSSKLGACRNRRRCVDDMMLLIVCAGTYDRTPLASFDIPPLVFGFLVARRENRQQMPLTLVPLVPQLDQLLNRMMMAM